MTASLLLALLVALPLAVGSGLVEVMGARETPVSMPDRLTTVSPQAYTKDFGPLRHHRVGIGGAGGEIVGAFDCFWTEHRVCAAPGRMAVSAPSCWPVPGAFPAREARR